MDQLIFTGVAGASSPDLNIGDIVISSQLYQHDMDARPLMLRHEIPLTGMTFLKADFALMKKAQAATSGLLATLSEKIPPEELGAFAITQPKCVLGTIATGDQFIGDSEQTATIMTERPETVAVEMEGAAVAQVCNDYKVPFVVIRTISDKANHKSVIDFPRFIENVGRHYAEHIVTGMLVDDCDALMKDGSHQAMTF